MWMPFKMPPARPGYKYCQWQEADMEKALAEVKKGAPIAAAARTNNVPRKTLSDRVHKKVKPGAKMGAPTKIPTKYEEDLVKYITYMAKRAFPLTVNQILMFAWSLDKSLGLNTFGDKGPSLHWWHGFKKRHPEVTLRRPDHLDRSRATHSTVENLREYFSILKKTLDDNNLTDDPQRIWNCDESIVDLNKSTQKVVVPRRSKHSHSRQVAGTQHISIHCCVSANGGVMSPYIIFSKAFPGGNYAKDGPDGALYGKSESGFMDEHLFLKWFERIFLKECPQDRENKPVLLLMDGHISHCSPALISKAKEENVILFALVPHTTHICQPLDVAVYKSLKVHIGKFIKIGQALRGDLWIAKKDVPRIIKTPFEEAMSLHNIKQGFRKCGVYPFDPNAVDKKLIMRGVPEDEFTDLSLPPRSPPQHTDAGMQTDEAPNETEAPTTTTPTPNSDSNSPTQNPLVKFGIVSPEIASIFFCPREDIPSGRKQPLRTQSKARVMTSDEVMADINRQKKELEEKQERQKQRKEERERKKAEKEKLEAEKRKRKEEREQRKKQKTQDANRKHRVNPPPQSVQQASSPEKLLNDDREDDNFCGVCGKDFEEDDEDQQELWVGCSGQGCGHWSCTECLPEKFNYNNDYFCNNCVESLLQESEENPVETFQGNTIIVHAEVHAPDE